MLDPPPRKGSEIAFKGRGQLSMACSMASAACCTYAPHSKLVGPQTVSCYPMPVPVPCCRRSSLGGSFNGLPLKESLFLGGARSLRDILLLSAANSQCPASGHAYLPALQVVNAQKMQVNSGSESDGKVLQSQKPSWDGTNALAVTEGFCIVVAAASYTTSVLRSKQTSLVASSSAEENKFLSKIGKISTWYVPALWAALVINAILRTVQRRSSTKSTQRVWDEKSVKDFTLDQRVGQLEEDVQGVATVAQMLSRHLEKLGIRFRVTRRTLRDPIQETVVLTQKTSEVVQALASREEALEKELEETQRVLVAMQAQQAKQLDLLVSGMTKTLKAQQASERRILQELSRRLGEATDTSKNIRSSVSHLKEKAGTPNNGKQEVMRGIGTLWQGFKKKSEKSTSSSSSSQMKPSFSEEGKGQKKDKHMENGRPSLTPETNDRPSKKSTYNPETSFAKEDFWATAIPRDTSDNPASSQTVGKTDAELQEVPELQGSTSPGSLDSFFSGKRRVHSPKHDTVMHERDYSDPGVDELYSQSERSSSSNGFS